MLGTLKAIREKYGSAEGYVIQKCGLTKDEVQRIRKNLIVEAPLAHERVQESL